MSAEPRPESESPRRAQLDRFTHGSGFIAALDESGGSTPAALARYGIDENQYRTEAEMFDLIHEARTRVITDPAFTRAHIIAAILFAGTLEREIEGRPVADYLWRVKGIVPLVKIDDGLQGERDGVRVMREIAGLDARLADAGARGVFGTKARSFIGAANERGIALLVAQQFQVAEHVLTAGMLPILEPEVDVHAADKADAEQLLKVALLRGLAELPGSDPVAIKVTLPTVDGFYGDLIAHPRVARVVALSGGLSREDANDRLARNPGLIASFSRALLAGLRVDQDPSVFSRTLATSIEAIARASNT